MKPVILSMGDARKIERELRRRMETGSFNSDGTYVRWCYGCATKTDRRLGPLTHLDGCLVSIIQDAIEKAKQP